MINTNFLKSIANYLKTHPENEELLLNRKLLAEELEKILEVLLE